MTLDEARQNIGAGVVYDPPGHLAPEDGTIVRVSEQWVHVRYGHQTTTKATSAECLTLAYNSAVNGPESPVGGRNE